MLELINVEDLYENSELLIMDTTFYQNEKIIENIEIGFKNTYSDVTSIKTIKNIK